MNFDHIVFASGNEVKVAEVKTMLSHLNAEIHSGLDLDLPEVDETATTFVGNSQLKAKETFAFIKENNLLEGSVLVIADDSGLCVDALEGRPGVYTKRYSREGDYKNTANDYDRLMDELKDVPAEQRSCQFVCIISAISDDINETFEGVIKGKVPIEAQPANYNKQYNPVFIPEGQTESFAQLGPERKAEFSHRGDAIRKTIAGLNLQ